MLYEVITDADVGDDRAAGDAGGVVAYLLLEAPDPEGGEQLDRDLHPSTPVAGPYAGLGGAGAQRVSLLPPSPEEKFPVRNNFV